MLTQLVERGMSKCEMYFPNLDGDFNMNNERLKFGKFEINYLSEKPLKDYVIREFDLINTDLNEKRHIYHCQYLSWPDFGEPQNVDTFLSFMAKCIELGLLSDQQSPPIVHCSAGVGRTGTFILVDVVVKLVGF